MPQTLGGCPHGVDSYALHAVQRNVREEGDVRKEMRSSVEDIVTLGEVVADIYRSQETRDTGRSSGGPLGGVGFTAMPGGAPANVAVWAARLGSRAAFVGSVGDDLFGSLIVEELSAAGVDTGYVVRRAHPYQTSIAFVELSEDGDRSFTFYRSSPAADEMLSPADVGSVRFTEGSFVCFGSIPLIVEPARSAVAEAVELAARSGGRPVFDVNLRPDLWEDLEAASSRIAPLLRSCEVVKMSEEELGPMLGTEDPEAASQALLEGGVSLSLVSLGKRGAFFATGQTSGYVPAPQVEVVDATGAGDAFLAATLTSIGGDDIATATAETLRRAVSRGTAAGSLACTALGAVTAAPTTAQLDSFVAGL